MTELLEQLVFPSVFYFYVNVFFLAFVLSACKTRLPDAQRQLVTSAALTFGSFQVGQEKNISKVEVNPVKRRKYFLS